ncbi:MAG TPA: winged helix-turn-helix domain-containing protein [Thermoanaerobaculia bacterium]|nr:winged helix-turn-helix domain-containing protein [Thermoanaerobaculia bacterium]
MVSRHPSSASLLEFGPFRFDVQERILWRDGVEVTLPPRVLSVLSFLLERPGKVVSKQVLIDSVWNGTFVTETSLTEAVSLLRQALDDDPQNPVYLQTVHRRGYRFIAPVEAVQSSGPRETAGEGAVDTVTRPVSRLAVAIIGLITLAALVAFLGWRLVSSEPARPPARLSMTLPEGMRLLPWVPSIAISPDGKTVVFAARDSEDQMAMYQRRLDSFDSVLIEGTEHALAPFFSPDGEWLGFFQGERLMKVRLSGGPPMEICPASKGYGATWSPVGSIIFGAFSSGLRRVSAAGGVPEVLTTPDPLEGEVTHAWPEILPGGKVVIFTIFANTIQSAKVAALSLESLQKTIVLEGAVGARWVPGGRLAFARSSGVAVAGFDPEKLRLTGAGSGAFRDVAVHPYTGMLQLDVADDGTVIYIPASGFKGAREIVRVHADGNEETLSTPQRLYRNLELSPDGTRAAVTILDDDRSDVWVADLVRGSLNRLTFEGFNIEPVWSADGEWVYFSSNRSGPYGIHRRRASGEGGAERVIRSGRHQHPLFWAPDGKTLVYGELSPDTGFDLWLLESAGDGWKSRPFLRSPSHEFWAQVSPDGRWILYGSDETGQWEVFLANFPEAKGKWQISTGGGADPFWSADGKTIHYDGGDAVMGVAFSASPGVEIGPPLKILTDDGVALAQRGPAPGEMTLIRENEQPQLPHEIHVVLNWARSLE